MRLDRQKNIGGGLQKLLKETNHFVDNSASLPQSADPHLEQPGISITMSTRKKTVHPQHLHTATKQSQHWSQRIDRAPHLQ